MCIHFCAWSLFALTLFGNQLDTPIDSASVVFTTPVGTTPSIHTPQLEATRSAGRPAPMPRILLAAQAGRATEMPNDFFKPRRHAASARDEGGSPFFRALGFGIWGGAGLDIATTEIALSRGGFREGNPLVANRGVRLSSHVLTPALVGWTTEELHKRGRKKLALFIRIASVSLYGYAVAHNLRMMGSQ